MTLKFHLTLPEKLPSRKQTIADGNAGKNEHSYSVDGNVN
jgi:hypothetical protein